MRATAAGRDAAACAAAALARGAGRRRAVGGLRLVGAVSPEGANVARGVSAISRTSCQQPLRFSSKSDWATNVLLFVPLGFLATGLALGRVPAIVRRAIVLPLVVAGCTPLSFLDRVWPVVARRSLLCSGRHRGREPGRPARGQLLAGRAARSWPTGCTRFRCITARASGWSDCCRFISLALFALKLLPLDLTLRPTEIYDKFQAGRINLLPFADLTLTIASAAAVAGTNAAAVPGGRAGGPVALAARRHRPTAGTHPCCWARRSWRLFETCAVVRVQRAQLDDAALTGLVGIAAGWALAHWRLGPAPREPDRACAQVIAATSYRLAVV